MKKQKSKFVFAVLATIAICLLVAISIFAAESMYTLAFVSIILFVATFGIGFTLKKKYRENDWL